MVVITVCSLCKMQISEVLCLQYTYQNNHGFGLLTSARVILYKELI